MTIEDFLELPLRTEKPRATGVTATIDGGLPASEIRGILDAGAAYLDLWKLGWGTAYIDPGIEEKLELLRHHGIGSCPGGTFLELANQQGRAATGLEWCAHHDFTHIEVSNGLLGLSREGKSHLIELARQRFTVWSEVGAKDPEIPVDVETWVRNIGDDLEAGASRVVIEGRESGAVGVFRSDRSVRADVVDALLDKFGSAALVFEAPHREQQAWFVRHVGTDVNLANVNPREAIALETLRLGLRADTAHLHQSAASRGRLP